MITSDTITWYSVLLSLKKLEIGVVVELVEEVKIVDELG